MNSTSETPNRRGVASDESIERNLKELGLSANMNDSLESADKSTLEPVASQPKAKPRFEDEFLANMSHELRTPLNAVLGMSEVLRDGYLGTLTEEQREAVCMIHSSGAHLLELINSILDLSMAETNRLRLDIMPLNISDVCRSCVGSMEGLASEKNISIEYKTNTEMAEIEADERRLRQCLRALLSNAVKFTNSGGRVGLELQANALAAQLEICVWDTGVGIASEDQERILKPFVQIDMGAARAHEGSGLGLALTSSLVKLHGGELKLESQLGTGSRFYLRFPWKNTEIAIDAHSDNSGNEPNPAKSPSSLKSPPLVLIADDTPSNVLTVRSYLEAKGYRTVSVDTGFAVLEFLQSHIPAAILMDLKLPGMDGLEAMRRIRSDVTLSHIPIVALTAQAMPGDREKGLQAGANAYLTKPLVMKSLGTLLDELLKNNPRPSEQSS